jgi:hypothetical protein
VLSPQGGTAWSGPAPPGGEGTPDSVSCPFSSRDFSYLIKTTKILMEKFNANLSDLNFYLFENEFCRFMHIVMDEFFQRNRLNNINIFII